MTTLYGIPNCDTVKRARAWLNANGVAHSFQDFKTQGLPEARLDAWLQAVGWQALLNRKGTTWRKLDPATQAAAQHERGARATMLEHPSVIKRPVVQWGGPSSSDVSVGFKAEDWDAQRAAGG